MWFLWVVFVKTFVVAPVAVNALLSRVQTVAADMPDFKGIRPYICVLCSFANNVNTVCLLSEMRRFTGMLEYACRESSDFTFQIQIDRLASQLLNDYGDSNQISGISTLRVLEYTGQ